jgi:hypothetical protein
MRHNAKCSAYIIPFYLHKTLRHRCYCNGSFASEKIEKPMHRKVKA